MCGFSCSQDRHYINEILLKVALSTIKPLVLKDFKIIWLFCLLNEYSRNVSCTLNIYIFLFCWNRSDVSPFFFPNLMKSLEWVNEWVIVANSVELDFYSASSLKQQSAGRHVTPLWHIILIPGQQVFALSP